MKVKEMVVASLAALLAGCTCTTISDEYSAPDPDKSGALRYKKVADLDSRGNYSADVIPVVLRMKECQEKRDPISDLHGIAWLCTIGLFPMWDTYERTWEVEVKTPLGVKSGTCTKTRREYFGWVPYLLPAAASDSEMKSDPSGELARRVVAQFKSEWTPEKVAALNTAERNRIAAQRKRADELLTAKDWKAVIALCSNEKDERFADEYRRKVKEAETQALKNMNKSLSGLLAKHEYDQAEKVLSSEYANWKQVDGHDAKAWIAFSATILKQKEEFRVAQEKKAQEAARKKVEAAREKAKKEIEQLLNAGKYEEAVAACEKEVSQAEGARYGDKLFWLNCKMTAMRKGTDAKTAAIRKELDARLQSVAKDRIAQIHAFAKKSAEEGNINFFGFFAGMSQYDAYALAEHYGLEDEEYSIDGPKDGDVTDCIWISLKGIRRLMKKGNTFKELRRLVESRIGDMSIDTDAAFKEAFDSSLATVLSLGEERPSVPKAKYVRETIDGFVARMFDGEEGGLVISQKNPKAREPIATEAAKVEYDAYSKISKITKPLDDLKREIKAEKERLEREAQAEKEQREREAQAEKEQREREAQAEKERLEREAQAEKERLERKAVISEILNNMVSIPGKDFMMGKYEVTTKQWTAVMGHKMGGDSMPVVQVSYNNCKKFLAVLNSLPEVQDSGLTFRLPKEAEWEYACRAGATGDYCKLADGTEITEKTLGEVAWYRDNNEHRHPVGQKKPNAFGLYDMHGNVREWCEDLRRAGSSDRVYRGGCWSDSSRDCAAGHRGSRDPDYSIFYLGFRLAASQDVNQ